MLYGVPYMGSKTKIANNILRQLPSGKRFIDLFGGGFAMSHAAALSGKYNQVVYSDYNRLIVDLIQKALSGNFNYKIFRPEFITREKFIQQKDVDGYVKYIWSFGNNGNNYIFGSEVEHLKHIAHDYVVFGKYSYELERICRGVSKAVTSTNISIRRKQFCTYCRKCKHRFDLERLEQLERLQRLQQLEQLEKIITVSRDYQEYQFQSGDVVYCDPPYEGTAEYDTTFDFKSFYNWVASRDYKIYFSSYSDISDDRFMLIWAKRHKSTLSAMNNNCVKYECLFTNKR